MCCKSIGGQFEKERSRAVKHPTETIVATMWTSTCICIDLKNECTLVLELNNNKKKMLNSK